MPQAVQKRKRREKLGQQLPLKFRQHGGWRKGAGRKPGKRAGVRHRSRGYLAPQHPAHITLKLVSSLPSLRSCKCMSVLRQVFLAAKERLGMRLIQFSVQRRHIHLIVEAEGTRSLSRGMQGLCIRIAKSLNKRLDRKGAVFADRFHSHVLSTAAEVFFALKYVLLNTRRHEAQQGRSRERMWIDSFSSGSCFEGWKGVKLEVMGESDRPVAHPKTFLLRVGWRFYGEIELDGVPGRPG